MQLRQDCQSRKPWKRDDITTGYLEVPDKTTVMPNATAESPGHGAIVRPSR